MGKAACDELYAIREGQSLLSSGQKALLKICFDLWNKSGGASIEDMTDRLDSKIFQALSELFIAIGSGNPGDQDVWEEKWSKYDPASDFFED